MSHSASVLDLPPARLFKYRTFDRGHDSGTPYLRDADIIERAGLWASSPLWFNDPFDCIPAIDLSGTAAEREQLAKRTADRRSVGETRPERRRQRAEAIKALRSGLNVSSEEGVKAWTDLLPRFGVVCLAACSDDMLMWGYYADGHRGYCLEFDTKCEPLSGASRVTYSEERTIFRPLDANRNQLMERTMLRKARFWQHEQEWRIVKHTVGNIAIAGDALKAIIMGANIAPADEESLRRMAGSLLPKIEIKRAVLDHRTFSLTIEST